MSTTAKRIFGIVLLTAAVMTSNPAAALEPSPGGPPGVAKEEQPEPLPDLADIRPLAIRLAGRLAALENQIFALSPDVSKFEKRLAAIEENLKRPADQLSQLMVSKDFGLRKLVMVREAIKREDQLLNEISSSLRNSIQQAGVFRKEWLAEKKRWSEWQSAIIQEGTFDQFRSVFEGANETIDRALNLVLPQFKAMLAMQEKVGNIQIKIYALIEELNGRIMVKRRSVLTDKFLPMLSSQYMSQFNRELYYDAITGLEDIAWPDRRFITQSGWILLLHVFISVFLAITIMRNREPLREKERWQFIAGRPYSVALFLGCMGTLWLYEAAGSPAAARLIPIAVGVVSLSRLVGGVSESAENRQFVYGVAIVLILTRLFEVVSLPLPLFRLYLVLTAVAGVVFCLRWAGKCRHKALSFQALLFRLFSLFFAFIVVAELAGKTGLTFYLFLTLIPTIGIVIAYVVFRHLMRGVLQWGLNLSLSRQSLVPDKNSDIIIRHAAIVADIVLWGLLFIPTVLRIWKVYDTFGGAVKGFLALGFEVGAQRISIGLVITAAGILYGTLVVSWIIQKIFLEQVLTKRQVEMGVRLAMAKLVHYLMVFVGFLLALSALGLEVTKLTIMLSALGVGIGFGLQGIVNNFVSGIILLFERPVRVGDMVEIGGQWAVIKRIGLRSTSVRTFDEADLIIPNANMVNNEVTNWTLSNRRVRLQIPVGVAYGSDVPLVIETLLACGKENPWAAKSIDPQVLFLRFGDSALEFELRVWVMDVDQRLIAGSEIHREIDRRFREANIQIAFPQRDLHLRSVDESINLQTPKISG